MQIYSHKPLLVNWETYLRSSHHKCPIVETPEEVRVQDVIHKQTL